MASYRSRKAKALRVYCPVDAETHRRIQMGGGLDAKGDSAFTEILRIVQSDDALGNFGVYKSVVEVLPAWELFTPAEGASPILGKSGVAAVSPTVALTIYISEDAADEVVDRAIRAIFAAHPWEVPVVELSETRLLTRP